MNQTPHLPYSLNIAPFDFFLFEDLNHKLQGCSYDSADEYFFLIIDWIENLEKLLLRRVFDE
jgi:hypothetical protein